MAQLRYSKAIACGTAITVGLVSAYLYKKRINRRVLRRSLGEDPCKQKEFESKSEVSSKESCQSEENRLSPMTNVERLVQLVVSVASWSKVVVMVTN